VNQNMVVSWPAHIKDKGGMREQFVHVIDVVPKILEDACSVSTTLTFRDNYVGRRC